MPVIGQQAPAFSLPDVHGTPIEVPDPDSSALVVVFFPFAFSEVCTGELAALADNLAMFHQAGAEVVAVSCDPVFALRAYDEQHDFGFDLLSDFWPHGAISSRYGVFDPAAGYAHRGSVLIDEQGTIRWRLLTGSGQMRPISAYRAALTDLVQAPDEDAEAG